MESQPEPAVSRRSRRRGDRDCVEVRVARADPIHAPRPAVLWRRSPGTSTTAWPAVCAMARRGASESAAGPVASPDGREMEPHVFLRGRVEIEVAAAEDTGHRRQGAGSRRPDPPAGHAPRSSGVRPRWRAVPWRLRRPQSGGSGSLSARADAQPWRGGVAHNELANAARWVSGRSPAQVAFAVVAA